MSSKWLNELGVYSSFFLLLFIFYLEFTPVESAKLPILVKASVPVGKEQKPNLYIYIYIYTRHIKIEPER